jgi:hypothetical protein
MGQKSRRAYHKQESIIKKAKKHFSPVLRGDFGEEPVFLLAENDPNLVSGACTTTILPLTGFTKLFGDLVEVGDFHIESYKRRNKERELCIPEAVFDKWKEAGCLQD